MAARRKRVEPAAGLGALIYDVRKGLGLSAAEFAERVGLQSHAQVSRWESGRETPGLLALLRIGSLAKDAARRAVIEECRLQLECRGWLRDMRGVFQEVGR